MVETSLCANCKYMKKCKRLSSIHWALADFTGNTLENYFIDVDISYKVSDCIRYAPVFSNVNDCLRNEGER